MGRYWHRLRGKEYRLGLLTALAFISGYIMYARAGITVNGMPLNVTTALLYAAIVGPAAMLTYVFLPSLSLLTEAAGISRLAFALFVYCFPDVGFVLAAMPFFNASIVIGGALLLCWACRDDSLPLRQPLRPFSNACGALFIRLRRCDVGRP